MLLVSRPDPKPVKLIVGADVDVAVEEFVLEMDDTSVLLRAEGTIGRVSWRR
jgi:hypothetical protein